MKNAKETCWGKKKTNLFWKQKRLQQVKSHNQISLADLCAQAKHTWVISAKLCKAQCPNIDQIAGPSSHILLSLILDTIESKCNKDRLQLWLVFSLYVPTNFLTKKILKF